MRCVVYATYVDRHNVSIAIKWLEHYQGKFKITLNCTHKVGLNFGIFKTSTNLRIQFEQYIYNVFKAVLMSILCSVSIICFDIYEYCFLLLTLIGALDTNWFWSHIGRWSITLEWIVQLLLPTCVCPNKQMNW